LCFLSELSRRLARSHFARSALAVSKLLFAARQAESFKSVPYRTTPTSSLWRIEPPVIDDFLKQNLDKRKGAPLLKLGAAGEGRLGDPMRAIRAIDREQGERNILEASSALLDIRADFLVRCQPLSLEEPTLFEMRLVPSPLAQSATH
jgi:hypothetical protein